MSFVKHRVKSISLIVIMDVVWACYYICSNLMISRTTSPFVTGMLLRGSALVFLTVLLLAKREFKELFKQGKTTWLLLLIGVLGFATDCFANIGLMHGSISTGTVLLKTDIIMANIITIVIFKQRLHINEWIGSILMLAGVVLVLGLGSSTFVFNWYDLFFIASALSVTIDAFIIKKVRNQYHVKSDMIAYFNNLVVLILFTLASFISGDFKLLGGVNADYIFYIILFAGGFAQTCIYIFYYVNLSRMAVWQVKLALLFIPLISLIFGVAINHDQVTWLQGLGIGIMLIGGAIVVTHIKVTKHKKSLENISRNLDLIPNEGEAQTIEEVSNIKGDKMNLVINQDAISLAYKGKKIFVHKYETPFINAVVAKHKWASIHGTFRVKEKIKDRIPLSSYEITTKTEDELYITFSNNDISMNVKVIKEDGALRFFFDSPNKEYAWEFNFVAYPHEGIFGGGEQYRQLDLKNERVTNLVSEHILLLPIVQKTLFSFIPYKEKGHYKIDTYAPMSTFVSSEKYAIRFEVASYGFQDFRHSAKHTFRYEVCPKSMLYVVGQDFKEIGMRLNKDIPNNEYIPDWVYNGLILGVQGGIDRAEEMADKLIAEGAKVSSVWCQDWSGKKVTAAGKQVYWNWEVDESLYPNLKERIAKLNEKGIRFLGYINPYLVKDGPLYNYCKEKGYLIKNQAGDVYHVKSTTFDAGMMDLTNPEMVTYLQETLIKKNMLDLGIDGWMADFGEYLPEDSVLFNGDAKILHNEWPTIWAKLNREAVESHPRAKEVFFFTRSAYNASQSYTTMMWNGDQHTDFSKDYGMPCTIPASFNLGFSGMTMVHSDIGGFISFNKLVRNKEIFVRWMEMNTFSMVMRSHETIRPEVNSQPYDNVILDYTKSLTNVHVALAPYLKECAKQAHEGIQVMRPDFYESGDFKKHKDVYSYMLGDEVYVCPIIEKGHLEKHVFLPDGEWIQFFTNKEYEGSKEYDINAPLGQPVAFYKKDGKFANLFASIKL